MHHATKLLAIALIVAACAGPQDSSPITGVRESAATVNRSVATASTTTDEVVLHAGTFASDGGFYLTSGSRTSCGFNVVLLGNGEIAWEDFCGPLTFDAPTAVVINGGAVDVTATVNGVVTGLGTVQGDWRVERQFIDVPAGTTITLTAHAYSGYEFVRWDITDVSGNLHRTSATTIVRPSGSADHEYVAYFRKLAHEGGGSGGSGGGGDDGGGDGGAGGCIICG